MLFDKAPQVQASSLQHVLTEMTGAEPAQRYATFSLFK